MSLLTGANRYIQLIANIVVPRLWRSADPLGSILRVNWWGRLRRCQVSIIYGLAGTNWMILENTSETPGDSLLKTLGGTWRSLGSVSKGCVISLGAEGTELEAAGTGELSMLVCMVGNIVIILWRWDSTAADDNT